MARSVDWSKYNLRPLKESEAQRMRERNRPGIAKDARTRQFIDTTTGEIVSRRQAENRRLVTDGGWDTWSQWQRTTSPHSDTHLAKRWRHFAEAAVRKGEYTNLADAAKGNNDLSKSYNEWRKTDFERGVHGKGYRGDKRNRPHGPYARYLEASGVRPEGANYPVGGSPKRGKK